MAGFQVATPEGIKVIQARALADGSWVQELALEPARRTGVSPAERLTVGSGAVVTLSPPGTATHALLAVENADVRWYDTGDTPTTGANGNGPKLVAGDYLELNLGSLAAFKMIAVSSSAIVHALYYKYG